MSASDTPRTDALDRGMFSIGSREGYTNFTEAMELARVLERELADAKETAERYRLKTLSQDAEIARWQAEELQRTAERDELKAEVLDEVKDRARETCHTAPQATDYLGRKAGELVTDSGAISSRADDLRRLSDAGRFKIQAEMGRMVVGYWPENDPENNKGDKST